MLSRLGPPLLVSDRADEAAELAEAAVEMLRDTGNQRELALALHVLGCAENDRGEFAAAAETLQESLAIARAAGDKWMECGDCGALYCLHCDRGTQSTARRSHARLMTAALALGNDLTCLFSLGLLAVAAAQDGDAHLSGLFWGAVERLDMDVGETMWRRDRLELQKMLPEPSAEFTRGHQEGRELGTNDALNLALHRPHRVHELALDVNDRRFSKRSCG